MSWCLIRRLTAVHTPSAGSSPTYPSTPRSAETLRASPSCPSFRSSPPTPSPSYRPGAAPAHSARSAHAHAHAQATRSSFLLHLKRNSAAELLDSVEWVTDTFGSLRTALRDRDAELALTRDYVAYLERVVEERDARIAHLEHRARRDHRAIQRHAHGLDIAWQAMLPREAQQRRFHAPQQNEAHARHAMDPGAVGQAL